MPNGNLKLSPGLAVLVNLPNLRITPTSSGLTVKNNEYPNITISNKGTIQINFFIFI
jgi:hypothetical protein